MNMNDGKRVHEKLGADKIMYNLTGLIVVLGFYEWLRVVFTLAFPGWIPFLQSQLSEIIVNHVYLFLV